MPIAERVQWAKVRVTITVIVALSILSVLVYLLTGGNPFRPWATLRVYLPDASGIVLDAPVRLNGIGIGYVKSISLSGLSDLNRVIEVRLALEEQLLSRIPVDSLADVVSDNIAGDKYISITRGRSSEAVTNNGTLAVRPPSTTLTAADLSQVEYRVRNIDAMLKQIQEGRTVLGQFFRGETFYNDINKAVIEMNRDFERAVAPRAPLGRMVYSDTDLNRIRAPLQKLDQQLKDIQDGKGPGRFLRDDTTYEELRANVRSLRRYVDRAARAEFLSSDVLYNRLNRKVGQIITAVDEMNAGKGLLGEMLVSAQPYESLTGSSREMEKAVREFRENPQKFLRIDLNLF